MAKYCEKSDLILTFGRLNVYRWADLDGTGDTAEIEARITNACELASAEIEDVLRNRRYKFPLTHSKTLSDIVAKMAGLHLHDSRGVIDDQSSTDAVSHIRKEVEAKLAQIRAGEVYIEGDQYSNAPCVVPDETISQLDDRPRYSSFDPFRPYFGQQNY